MEKNVFYIQLAITASLDIILIKNVFLIAKAFQLVIFKIYM